MFFSDIYQADSPAIFFPPFPHPTRFGVQSARYRTEPLRFKPTLPRSALWRFSLSSDSNWYFGFACGCLLSLPTGGVGGSLRRQRREKRLVPTWLIPVPTAGISSNSSRWFQFVAIPTLAKPVSGLLSDTAPDKQPCSEVWAGPTKSHLQTSCFLPSVPLDLSGAPGQSGVLQLLPP